MYIIFTTMVLYMSMYIYIYINDTNNHTDNSSSSSSSNNTNRRPSSWRERSPSWAAAACGDENMIITMIIRITIILVLL